MLADNIDTAGCPCHVIWFRAEAVAETDLDGIVTDLYGLRVELTHFFKDYCLDHGLGMHYIYVL